jgi:hypothetical protein
MSVSDDFKKNISYWLKLEAEEKKYKDGLRDLKDKKTIIEEDILDYMKSNNITHKDITVGDGIKLKYAELKTQENISKRMILDRLTKYFNNVTKANEITNFIYSERKSDVKSYLKKSG